MICFLFQTKYLYKYDFKFAVSFGGRRPGVLILIYPKNVLAMLFLMIYSSIFVVVDVVIIVVAFLLFGASKDLMRNSQSL